MVAVAPFVAVDAVAFGGIRATVPRGLRIRHRAAAPPTAAEKVRAEKDKGGGGALHLAFCRWIVGCGVGGRPPGGRLVFAPEPTMADVERETGTAADVHYNEQGLVPAIVQDAHSGEVMMFAWMNAAALQHTLETGKATFYSRSRKKMWVKGESSGHVQRVQELRVDCDQDCVLLRVEPAGPACHVGYPTCFYRAYESDGESLRFVQEKAFDPGEVYK